MSSLTEKNKLMHRLLKAYDKNVFRNKKSILSKVKKVVAKNDLKKIEELRNGL